MSALRRIVRSWRRRSATTDALVLDLAADIARAHRQLVGSADVAA